MGVQEIGNEMNSPLKNYRFPILLLLAIAAGSIVGLIWKERAVVLKPLGEIFINLMFVTVVPLVFVSIAGAVGNMMNMKRLEKILGNMFLVFIVTGILASALIIGVVTLFPPAKGVSLPVQQIEQVEFLHWGEQIVRAVSVPDFVNLLSKAHMLPLIVFSILFGFAVSATGGEERLIARGLEALSNVLMKMIGIIMWYAPIGLGAYFAALIGEFGPQLLGAYWRAMVIYYPLCFVYFFFAFAAYAYFAGSSEGVRTYFRHISPPAITSFATGSSIATLPVNLKAAEKMGVPKDIREIVLPIGATMHMDGSCLSSILKISFLFGIYGQSFSGWSTLTTAVLVSVIGGVVMSGVPGGGLIGEMLIVNLYGFPPEAFPIIATIGFLVDPPATMINAAGDSVASMMVARLVEGKNWLRGKGYIVWP